MVNGVRERRTEATVDNAVRALIQKREDVGSEEKALRQLDASDALPSSPPSFSRPELVVRSKSLRGPLRVDAQTRDTNPSALNGRVKRPGSEPAHIQS